MHWPEAAREQHPRAGAPRHRRAQGVFARQLGSGVRAPARQRTAVARRNRSLARRPQSLSRAASARAGATPRRALRRDASAQLLPGRGSDESIDLLVRGFCRAGIDNVIICPPTFGMYAVAARIQGAEVREVPLLRDRRLRARYRGRARGLRRQHANRLPVHALTTRPAMRWRPRPSSSCWSRLRTRRWSWSTRPTSNSPATRR